MTLSILSRPVSVSWGPTRSRLPWSWRARAGYSVALISDDLPAPDTPVIATITPSGIVTSTFFRLCSRAPRSSMACLPTRRVGGTAMLSVPARNRPVIDAATALTWAGVPSAMTWPPWRPAPGPKSMTQSAASIVASSCSTTSTVLPRSRRRCSVRISRSLSRWCRPIDGSSRTYSTPDSSLPSCDARRMRCASPPDSEPAARSSVRYSSPTSSKNVRRFLISFSTSPAICARVPASLRPWMKS